MKIFLSWSTEPSMFIAETLKDWIPLVIQAARPWFSATDIDRGARWGTEIANELAESKFGILCMTPENLNAPWIHFEAGALAKTLTKTHVVPVLLKLGPTELVGPLTQFNAAKLNKDDMQKLIQTINKALDQPLDRLVVERSFEMWWPKLEEKLLKVPKIKITKENTRTDRDILEEILGLIRVESNSAVSMKLTKPIGTKIINGYLINFSFEPSSLTSGTFVYSQKFGKGKINAVSGKGDRQEAIIIFDSDVGIKKLLIKYANLGIILKESIDDVDLENLDLPF
jgi:hypothetical protein